MIAAVITYSIASAQIIGGHCYLERSAVQMAVASCGTFGVNATRQQAIILMYQAGLVS
ncbi:MAG: hypothetical protein RML94_13055 [Bacteroidia bacterium]|nr:hypothetical protein [Bacteroidia bacterium]